MEPALRLSTAMFSKRLVILPHRNYRLRLSFRSLARRSLPFPWSCNPPRSQEQQTGLGDGSKQTNANETSGKVCDGSEPSQAPPEAPRIFSICNWSSKDPNDKTRPQANSGNPKVQQYPPILVLYCRGILKEVM